MSEVVQGRQVDGVMRRDIRLTPQEHRHINRSVYNRAFYAQVVSGEDKRLPDVELVALEDVSKSAVQLVIFA